MVQPASKRLVTEAKLATEIADFVDDTHTHALPTYVMLTATYSGGTAVRPSSDSTVRVFWVCTTSATPPVVTSGTAGRYAIDIVSVVA